MSEQSAFFAQRNRDELGPSSDYLQWLSLAEIESAEAERSRIVAGFPETVHWSFNGTKPHYGPLSPGCQRCGEGMWSCLFINGRCNANCFFCPASQEDIGEPGTSSLEFADPDDYVDYIATSGFQGVSLSGGEPLLTFDRSLDFIRTIRERLPRDLYLWMYTNGLLMTDEKARELHDAGIDEVRFNLHAAGYRLDGLKSALGIISTVTVEIPAVPEEEEQLLALVPQLSEMGVKHLHLHQLRCTRHNLPKMREKPYHFVHGSRATVLESEQLALKLVSFAAAHGLDLAVQYCAFAYKNPHQTMGARKRWARFVQKPWEEVTATGAIRSVFLTGPDSRLAEIADALEQADNGRWSLDEKHSRLFLPFSSVPDILTAEIALQVSYVSAVLVGKPTFNHLGSCFAINDRMQATIERRPLLSPVVIPASKLRNFRRLCTGKRSDTVSPALAEIIPFEHPSEGLAPYA